MAGALQIIGTAVSVIGALQQGQAARSAAQYNAQVAAQNADIARSEAQMQAQQSARENYLRLGAIRAAQGHAGGTGSSGSVLDVLADTAAQGELEKQNILYSGELKARGYQNTASLDEFSARSASTGSYLRAGTELLSGAANYYRGQEKLKRA